MSIDRWESRRRGGDLEWAVDDVLKVWSGMTLRSTTTGSDKLSGSAVDPRSAGAGSGERSLFGPEPVSVRDLIGEVVVPALPSGDRKPWSEVVVTPARRGGRLHLSWYDYGVVAMVVGSLVAGIICLLRGV